MLKVENLEYDIQKSNVTGPWDHKVLVLVLRRTSTSGVRGATYSRAITGSDWNISFIIKVF
jgi:hypothetical protein